ncbi:MAG: WhiB family transcriptional regulator [Acidimicrobiia bacterium]
MSLRASDLKTAEDTWQERALCRGPESALFFPPTTSERKDDREWREQKAKEICATCPVQPECLEYALSIREPHGIWGGLTEVERRSLLAQEVV